MKHKEIGGIQNRSVAEEVLPLRSNYVAEVNEVAPGQGGCCAISTGDVFVPLDQDPQSRCIRMHEPLHLEFSRTLQPKDMLDQGIEDSRLHRYCSATKLVEASWPSARQDEIATATKDLLGLKNNEPIDALVALRSIGILGQDISPEQLANIEAHLGADFQPACEKALAQLSQQNPTEKQWRKVRRILAKFFDENKPEEPGNEPGDFPQPGNERQDPVNPGEPGNEPVTETKQKAKRKKIPKPQKPKIKRVFKGLNPNEYQNPETGKGDLSECDELIDAKPPHRDKPMVSIYRLDMGANSIPMTPGQELQPATSGAEIYSIDALIDAQFNPDAQVFARRGEIGGGTILIDTSGSMHIPIETLEQFCRKLPAATIALYNALMPTCGSIYVFAANQRRATSLPRYHEMNWGGENYIDYQVLRWLLRQEAPRYLITDYRFTGVFSDVAHELAISAYNQKLITSVRTLEDMHLALAHKPIQQPVIGERWNKPYMHW